MQISLNFKHADLVEEFEKVDLRIKSIALYVANEFSTKLNKEMVVTSIYRSQSEQNNLRKSGAPAVVVSPHSDWRAIDIRINDIFGQDIFLKTLVSNINSFFKRKDGLTTALIHGEGQNRHLHLQVPKERIF